ncbi:MAG: aldo/keto reductase [Opitutales bacterium]
MKTHAPLPGTATPHNRLSLGCWTFGGSQWGGQDDRDSIAALEQALESGLTHWDTAIAYGGGRSEKVVGEVLKAQDARDRVYLATKGFPAKDPDSMVEALARSRINLGVDTLDLYYIHWPLSGVDMRPHFERLHREREQGGIRALGVSNFSVEEMQAVAETGPIDALQIGYNLLWRRGERDGVIDYCREHGIQVVTYSSMAQGILTGKFPEKPQFREGDSRADNVHFKPDVWPRVHATMQEIKALADDLGRPPQHLAIQWSLQQPGIDVVILGARNSEQVAANAEALAGSPLPADVLDRLTELSDALHEHLPDQENIFGVKP